MYLSKGFVSSLLIVSSVGATPFPPTRVLPRDPFSTCTPTPAPQRGFICGQQGSTNQAGILSQFTSCDGDYTGCYEICKGNAKCLTFSFNTATQQCTTYSKQVLKSNFQRGSSGVFFYNRRHCFTAPSCAQSVCPPPQVSCDNQGIQYAKYTNTQGQNNDALYSNFSDVYSTATPDFTGTTSSVGGFNYPVSAQPISVYGDSHVFNSDYFAINHRGYFFAPSTGTYTVQISTSDDIVLFWFGPNAYYGYTRDNADTIASISTAGGAGAATFNLNQGDYLPFRIVYGNGQAAAVFSIKVTDPQGNVLVDSQTGKSPYVVQFSCDGTSAPEFQPFGSEG